jgi:hypothetical protein
MKRAVFNLQTLGLQIETIELQNHESEGFSRLRLASLNPTSLDRRAVVELRTVGG